MQWFSRLSLGVKITLLACVLGLLVGIVAESVFFLRVESSIINAARERSRLFVHHVSDELVEDGVFLPPDELAARIDHHLHQRPNLRGLIVLDDKGGVLWPEERSRFPMRRARELAEKQGLSFVRARRLDAWLSLAPVMANGRRVGSVAVLLDLSELDHNLRVVRASYTILGLSLVLVLGLFFLVALRPLVIKPVRELDAVARELRAGNFDVRAAPRTKDEIGELSRSFNAMADALTQALNTAEIRGGYLRAVLDTQSDFLFSVDRERNITLMNARLLGALGLDEKRAQSLKCHDALDCATCLDSCVLLHPTRAAEGKYDAQETTLPLPSGEKLPVLKRAQVLRDENNEIAGMVETMRDMSQEAELRRLRHEWESFIRHEIRAPLNPIQGFAQILRDDPAAGEETVREYAGYILEAARNLNRILDLTREAQEYEAGRIHLSLDKANIVDTARAAAEEARAALMAGNGGADLRYEIEVEPGLDAAVVHDTSKMQRVLKNLIKNAWEHDPGLVRVTARDAGNEGGRDWFEISVNNGGAPVPSDTLDHIFEKYNTTKKGKGGTGLGTTIAKLFTEAHGGAIQAESNAENGTTFSIRLPRAPRETEPNESNDGLPRSDDDMAT